MSLTISVLSHILCLIYCLPINKIIVKYHKIKCHLYVDLPILYSFPLYYDHIAIYIPIRITLIT